jgi:hypothetical protein
VIFPWSLVNMTGALFWGMLARQAGFRTYVRSSRSSALAHTWFLVSFGVAGAIVMSVPGTLVQSALHERSIFALNPEVAESLAARLAVWEGAVETYLESLLGLSWSEHIGWYVVNWFQNCIRYIPDKTMSAAIALVVLKYGYPLFERELIHGGSDGDRRLKRAERYARALKLIGKEPSHEFCRRLTFATLIASLLFALCLPVLLMDFYRVTFKFFCVVYGFLLVVHLIRVAIAQNISAARADG